MALTLKQRRLAKIADVMVGRKCSLREAVDDATLPGPHQPSIDRIREVYKDLINQIVMDDGTVAEKLKKIEVHLRAMDDSVKNIGKADAPATDASESRRAAVVKFFGGARAHARLLENRKGAK